MEYTIEEMQAMLNIVRHCLATGDFNRVAHCAHPQSMTLTIST